MQGDRSRLSVVASVHSADRHHGPRGAPKAKKCGSLSRAQDHICTAPKPRDFFPQATRQVSGCRVVFFFVPKNFPCGLGQSGWSSYSGAPYLAMIRRPNAWCCSSSSLDRGFTCGYLASWRWPSAVAPHFRCSVKCQKGLAGLASAPVGSHGPVVSCRWAKKMALYFVSRKKKEKRCARLQYPPGQRRAVRKGYLARCALLRFGLRHVGGHENVLIILHPCFFFLCRECASAPCVSRLSRWSPRARQIKERPGKKGAIDLGVQSLPVVSLKGEKTNCRYRPFWPRPASSGGRQMPWHPNRIYRFINRARFCFRGACITKRQRPRARPPPKSGHAIYWYFLIKRRKKKKKIPGACPYLVCAKKGPTRSTPDVNANPSSALSLFFLSRLPSE